MVDSDSSSRRLSGLTGSGVAPITSSPASVDFGQALVNPTSATQTVTRTNNDTATESLALAESGGFTAANTTCGNNLEPAATCTAD